MFIIIVFDRVLKRSSPFLRTISTLSQGISHGMCFLAWEFLFYAYFISRSCIFFPATIITTK